MSRALFDANVLLDVLLARTPHFADSCEALRLVERGDSQGFVSAHTVPTLDYVLRRALGPAYSRAALEAVLSPLSIAAVTDDVIRRALQSPFHDFEDAVAYEAAVEAKLDCIVTRDPTGFEGARLPILDPHEFVIAGSRREPH